MGQDNTLSMPAKGDQFQDIKSDGPNPNGIVVGLLRCNDQGEGRSAVASLTWPDQMSAKNNGPERIALCLLSYSEKVAKLRAEGKIEKANIITTSFGAIAATEGIGILAQQGLLDKFIDNLGPGAQIILAQCPMHLQTGMAWSDWVMNNAVVRSENLLYGLKSILALNKQDLTQNLGETIRALVIGDLPTIYRQLLQSRLATQEQSNPFSVLPNLDPISIAREVVNAVSAVSLISKLRGKVAELTTTATGYIKDQGIMRVNTVFGLYERMVHLNEVDLRSVDEALKDDETIGSSALAALRRNRTAIKIVHGLKADHDVNFDQNELTVNRLGALRPFIQRIGVNGLDHFGLANVKNARVLVDALNSSAQTAADVRVIDINDRAHN